MDAIINDQEEKRGFHLTNFVILLNVDSALKFVR